MRALVLHPSSKNTAVEDVPKPVPTAGEVLVRVHAVALNAVDAWYSARPIAKQERRILGVDFAGVVEALGPDTPKDARAQVGARVSGFVIGACSVNEQPGAFAEYVALPYDLTWLVPETMALEAASSVSMCALTGAQMLYARLGLPAPFPIPNVYKMQGTLGGEVVLLVYGASTSLGLYAAQLVHACPRAGLRITLVGVASTAHHKMLSQPPYSYDFLVDYHSPTWPDEVRARTGGVDFALDCISEGETVDAVTRSFADDAVGDRIAVVRGPEGGGFQVGHIGITYGAVWEGLGLDVVWNDGVLKADPAGRAFAAAFYNFITSSPLTPNPVRIMPGGIERIVPDGFALLGENKVSARAANRPEEWMRPISGEKIVYDLTKQQQ